MGVQMLLNENQTIERDNQCIYLTGIDDAHYYRADNIEKAATGIPSEDFSILLSHTPEVYQQASYADFNLLLCGHTHDGQICLPGRIPITLDSVLPRHMGSGSWKYRDMIGISRCWLLYCFGAVQLPSGNHAPSPAVSQVARVNRIVRLAQTRVGNR